MTTTAAADTRQVIMERTYSTPISAVWEAITDKNKMKEWYFDLSGFKPEPGFEFNFTCIDHGKPYVHLCQVKEVISGKKLAYTWAYEGHQGESLVIFELFEQDAQTRLKLTHSGLETFPADDDFFAADSYAAGWTELLGNSLKVYLEK